MRFSVLLPLRRASLQTANPRQERMRAMVSVALESGTGAGQVPLLELGGPLSQGVEVGGPGGLLEDIEMIPADVSLCPK